MSEMLALQAKKVAGDDTYNIVFNHCAAPHEVCALYH